MMMSVYVCVFLSGLWSFHKYYDCIYFLFELRKYIGNMEIEYDVIYTCENVIYKSDFINFNFVVWPYVS